MDFEKGHLYHVYNQGNNRQQIFYTKANYMFFIKKMETHILPFADVVAWCLMPNHFHLMLVPRDSRRTTSEVGDSRRTTNVGDSRRTTKTQLTDSRPPTTTLNQSIGILLASYTRAIHKQEHITGSLFRQKTKAKCLTGIDGITPSYFNTAFGTILNANTPEKEYPKVCFDYIHNNPVKAGLVECAEDWEFSSIHEYNGIIKNGIINMEIAEEFGLFLYSSDDSKSSDE